MIMISPLFNTRPSQSWDHSSTCLEYLSHIMYIPLQVVEGFGFWGPIKYGWIKSYTIKHYRVRKKQELGSKHFVYYSDMRLFSKTKSCILWPWIKNIINIDNSFINKPAAQAADTDPSPLKLHQKAKSTHSAKLL